MATRFIDEATARVSPLYDQQAQATQAQLPAIQQLYDTLVQGLEGQKQTETQNILESASQRGVLRSTLPVDLQTQLGAAMLAQRGKLDSQRASDVAGVQKSLADIGIQKNNSIFGLADSLQQADLRERQFQMQQEQARQDYALKQRALAAESESRQQSQGPDPAAVIGSISGNLKKVAGRDGFVAPKSFNEARLAWVALGGKPGDFNNTFRAFANPTHLWQYGI